MGVTLASMTRSLDTVRAPIKDKSYSAGDIRDTAVDLTEMSDILADQYKELVAFHEQFQLKLADAPQLFRDAARIWRQYGAEERRTGEPEIAERCDEIAQLWDAEADTIERADADPLSIAELDRVMTYIGRSRLLLTRLLSCTPFNTGSQFLQHKALFEANLQEFIARFDDLRATIRGLTHQLQEEKDTIKVPEASQEPSHDPPASAPMAALPASKALDG